MAVKKSTSESRPVARYAADPAQGLTQKMALERANQGLSNRASAHVGKTGAQILRTNLLTLFNGLNAALAALVLMTGSYRNALFMIVILFNVIIGTVQEWRAKKMVEKLQLISAPTATVIRDGQAQSVAVEDIVLDDIMRLSSGMQICADAIVVEGVFEVNESMLTGESDPVTKRAGDQLMSGSFVVSGSALARVEHVGDENYAAQLARDARRLKKPNSELMSSLNRLIRVISYFIVPLGALLFSRHYFIVGDSWEQSVISTVAAMVGMIPEGLILLTSVALAVGVIRLAARKTLVQELYCMETLARVDVLCLDKTGTITTGEMEYRGMTALYGEESQAEQRLKMLTGALEEDNPTFRALKARFAGVPGAVVQRVPFSSARKWSGARFEGGPTLVLGAGEFVLGEGYQALRPQAEKAAENGLRVLVLAESESGFQGEHGLPDGLRARALIYIGDTVRAEAPDTLKFFAGQGVTVKVISGDNPRTVAAVAARAGLANAASLVDASTLKTEQALFEAADKYTVFGRVTPAQKQTLVRALKARGHTVAMTGDGVNDVPALKDADCSIAMASGSDAARQVANLVLLDCNFASMPQVVMEGRRVINNIRRSASLFLTKTIFSFLLTLCSLFLGSGYPFVPIQLTLFSSVAIGLPSFFLALEPNRSRVEGRFLYTVIKQALPGALTIALGVETLIALCAWRALPDSTSATLCTLYMVAVGLMVLFRVCLPFNPMRVGVFLLCVALLAANILVIPGMYSLTPLGSNELATLLIACAAAAVALPLLSYLVGRIDIWLSRRRSNARG